RVIGRGGGPTQEHHHHVRRRGRGHPVGFRPILEHGAASAAVRHDRGGVPAGRHGAADDEPSRGVRHRLCGRGICDVHGFQSRERLHPHYAGRRVTPPGHGGRGG